MKNFSMCTILIVIFSVLLITACGTDSNSGNDNAAIVDNAVVTDDAATTDDAVEGEVTTDEAADELSDADKTNLPVIEYPTETATSKNTGDVAANFIYYNEKNEPHQLAEFYKTKKLIFIDFSAYDCPYCLVEKNSISNLNKKKYVDAGLQIIVIMNGYLAGPKPSGEPKTLANFVEQMIDNFGEDAKVQYGYLNFDQQAKFKKYFSQGYPVNTTIDASNMQVVNVFEGWDETSSEKATDELINYFLFER